MKNFFKQNFRQNYLANKKAVYLQNNLKIKDMKYTIDFFELMFLAESVIPPAPIARSMCFDSFSEVHYHNMTTEQRKQFFEHVQKQHGFNLYNEQCQHFYARFNPNNQYKVKCFHDGKPQEVECYRYNGKYHTSMNRFINEEYVKEIQKI